MPRAVQKTCKIDTYRQAFVYVFERAAQFADASNTRSLRLEKEAMGRDVNIHDLSGNRSLARFGTGDETRLRAGPEGVRVLLISGAPREEPVAWPAPRVMSPQEDIRTPMRDWRRGAFIAAVR